MAFFGVLFFLAGIGSIIYGVNLNNNIVAQLQSFFGTGTINPGMIYIIIGGAGSIIGLIMLVSGIRKSKESVTINLSANSYSSTQYRNVTSEESYTSSKNLILSNKKEKYIKFIGKNWKDILMENNLEEYISIFENNKLTDLETITELNETDLEKLGITIMGDRKKILKIFYVNSIPENAISDKYLKNETLLIEKKWNKKYIVLQQLEIKRTPESDGENILTLEDGEMVVYLDQAYEEIKTKIIWYKINYKNVDGWCISNNLEKYYE